MNARIGYSFESNPMRRSLRHLRSVPPVRRDRCIAKVTCLSQPVTARTK
jgi:hypothetical protein